MHQLLDDYLCNKYPKIFADRNKPMTETCMCWGISTGNGWFSLLDNLCCNIQHHIDNPPYVFDADENCYVPDKKPTCPQVVAQQVKEKFGGLRFYAYGGDTYTRALIDDAEALSYDICEQCGRMDEEVGRNRKGWIQTTCREHASNPNDFTPNRSELGEIWKKVKDDEKREKEDNERKMEEWKKKQKQVKD